MLPENIFKYQMTTEECKKLNLEYVEKIGGSMNIPGVIADLGHARDKCLLAHSGQTLYCVHSEDPDIHSLSTMTRCWRCKKMWHKTEPPPEIAIGKIRC